MDSAIDIRPPSLAVHFQWRAVSGAARRGVILGHRCSQSWLKKENQMTTRFLAIAMAIAMLFGAQQAVAKSSTKTNAAAKKKHHKHHMKKAAAASTRALSA
jgi:hypothetical protein